MSRCGNLYFRRVRVWSYLTNVLSPPFLAPPTLSRGNLKTQLYFKHSRPERLGSFWSAPRIATSCPSTGSPRFPDFPSLCACSESSLTNLIGSGLNLLCFQIHSKPECRWTWPEVASLGADQKERGLWGREWCFHA